jgi:hypothetical protein
MVVWLNPKEALMQKNTCFPSTIAAFFCIMMLFFFPLTLSSKGIHSHGQLYDFTPETYENPTVISFSNGIRFDTREGEPLLPEELQNDLNETSYYLVQFTGPIREEMKTSIKDHGSKIYGYIPNYTLIVRCDGEKLDLIRNLSFVTWVGIFQPAYKISAPLLDSQGKGKVTIQLFPDAEIEKVTQKILSIGYSIDFITDHRLIKTIDATGELSILNEIARIPEILWIQAWGQPKLCNNHEQWVVQTGWASSVPGSGGWRIWNEGIRGKGIILSTSDTGIRTDHLVYYDPTYPINTEGEYPNHRKIVAYKLSPGATFGDDPYNWYHGSHVNCTVAGDDSFNGGAMPYDGVAKDARIYFVDLGDNTGGLHVNMSTLCDLVYQGGALGYHILQHSGSWGWWNSSGTYLTQDATLDAHVWENRDFLNLYAAGNEGGTMTIRNPGIAKNTLTIGGTQNGTYSNYIYSSSSRGPTQDGRIKPTIMAPGQDIYSADGGTTNGYQYLTGTSMATPASNAGVGLMRHYLLAGFYPSGSENTADSVKYQSAALLRTMAIVSADPNVGGWTVPSMNIGWGRLDVDSTLFFATDVRKLILLDDTIGLSTGQATSDTFVVNSSIPLRVCLAWTDTAAAANANPTLINDLNLELIAPDGTTYRGNQYSGGQSIANPSSWDNLNVEECCRINSPQTGNWQIITSGQQVVYDPQPFAYSITGDIVPFTGIEEGNNDHTPIHATHFNCRLLTSPTSGTIELAVFLPTQDHLTVSIFDASGRELSTVFDGTIEEGSRILKTNVSLPSGIYFIKAHYGRTTRIQKLLIVR